MQLFVLLKRLTNSSDKEEFVSETQKIQLAALERMEEMRERINQLEAELMEHKANPKKPVSVYLLLCQTLLYGQCPLL